METKQEEITGEVAGSLKKSDHPIRQIALTKAFFEHQSVVEREAKESGAGEGGDFTEVFKRTAREVISFAKERGWSTGDLSDEEINRRASQFLEEFKEIKMDDTFFHDLEGSLPRLFEVSSGVIVYTQGDPVVQPRKIEISGIFNLLKNAREASDRKDDYIGGIISTKKEAEVASQIDKFRGGRDIGEVSVVVYDDNVRNFSDIDVELKKYEKQKGVRVKRLYVFAKSGRVTEGLTPEKEEQQKIGVPNYETVQTVGELVDLILKNGIDPKSMLVFLDFDGALSDNRLMRARQAHIANKHVMKILKSIAQEEIGWDRRDKDTAEKIRSQIEVLYKGVASLWQTGQHARTKS